MSENTVPRQKFYDLTMDELRHFLKGKGKEAFRAQQLYRWIYGQRVEKPEEMTNLSKEFRSEVATLFDFTLPQVVSDLTSVDGTRKLLFDMGGGKTVESV